MTLQTIHPGGRQQPRRPTDWYADRIARHIRPLDTGCHQWTGPTYWDGAPKAHTPDGPRLAARAIAEHHGIKGATEPICDTRHCVNPAHRTRTAPNPQPAPKAAPKPKAASKPKTAPTRPEPKQRTHCPKGHPLAGDNLIPANLAQGKRNCATCHAERRQLRTRALMHACRATGLPKTVYIATFGASTWTALEVVRRVQAGLSLDGMPADAPRDQAALEALPPIEPAPARTHCPQGHELTDDNVTGWDLQRGVRTCRLCHNETRRRRRAARKAAQGTP